MLRRYTNAEIERRRELGLCFKCDEKLKPGHCFQKKQLQVLILSEENEPPNRQEEVEPEDWDKQGDKSSELMALSLNALSGFSGGKTIKLRGTCKGRHVLILILFCYTQFHSSRVT